MVQAHHGPEFGRDKTPLVGGGKQPLVRRCFYAPGLSPWGGIYHSAAGVGRVGAWVQGGGCCRAMGGWHRRVCSLLGTSALVGQPLVDGIFVPNRAPVPDVEWRRKLSRLHPSPDGGLSHGQQARAVFGAGQLAQTVNEID